ncbi:ABC-F family ATP-binding cassette domain-containing protein [Solwaraspora sp. WMMD1047]|uniref:ABC-F family ATP-binding cassette domain-containing protein n=1 Tax=Solwaraspora sp. WMMD1047 TaxID=3016102 RepID=UPI002415DE72|nr:ABC-F family ATP-binding cassette domain-containing protein [Solwaraspora sp. WMMD1047]MDG4833881.1 ABC-F family ATP-binding cassette domain-containing protein [Solwaraspora sp. WMMD1047]
MSSSALLAHDLVRTLGTRRVLDGVSLVAAPGQRIGLIGENGAGKSTLLRLLAGTDEPDAGQVVRPTELGFLHQEMPFDADATIAAVLDDALREARHDLAELDRLTAALAGTGENQPGYADLLAEYGERLDRAQRHDSWDADRRAAIVLAGLGLGGLPADRPLGSMSGGQRGRLALTALLVRRPTALLLDEPTNHLDDDAAAFLAEQLRALPGTVVAASHDRAFLDAVCTDLIDLDPGLAGPTRYGGNYTSYQEQKRAERERWQRQFEEEQQKIVELRHAAATTARHVAPGRPRRDNEKMGYDRTGGRVESQVSRRVRNATRRLAELERDQVRKPPEPLRLRTDALTSGSSDGMLVALRDVRVPGRLAIDRLDVSATDRLLVTGANGAGKSTLLAVLAGRSAAGRSAVERSAVGGQLWRRRGLTVGLLAQDSVFDRPDRTVRETYELALGPDRAEAVPLRSLGLIAGRDLDSRVGELSVGQRRRLALALLIADPPELLLLDEPTNHLSPGLADELEEALGSRGPGAVVVASHDRWLRSRWAGRQLALPPPGLALPASGQEPGSGG